MPNDAPGSVYRVTASHGRVFPADDGGCIHHIMQQRWASGCQVLIHSSPFLVVGAVLSGSVWYENAEHRSQTIGAGDLFAHLPGRWRATGAMPGGAELLLIAVKGPELIQRLSAHIGVHGQCWRQVAGLDHWVAYTKQAIDATSPSAGEAVGDLLCGLLRLQAQPKADSDAAAATLGSWERCQRILAAHALGLHSAGDLAKRVGVHPAHLNRLFHAHLGTTPQRALLKVRMDLARDMLLAGRSVRDTALACGYEDPVIFSRAFKRVIGLLPSHISVSDHS